MIVGAFRKLSTQGISRWLPPSDSGQGILMTRIEVMEGPLLIQDRTTIIPRVKDGIVE